MGLVPIGQSGNDIAESRQGHVDVLSLIQSGSLGTGLANLGDKLRACQRNSQWIWAITHDL